MPTNGNNTLDEPVNCVAAKMVTTIAEDLAELTHTTSALLLKWDVLMGHVVSTLQNRIPDGSVSLKTHEEVVERLLETHKLMVRGLITGFSVVVVVAVGAVKLVPYVIDKVIYR